MKLSGCLPLSKVRIISNFESIISVFYANNTSHKRISDIKLNHTLFFEELSATRFRIMLNL